MTKQFLNATEVCTAFQQVCRCGVSQTVRADIGRTGHTTDGVVHDTACGTWVDAPSASSEEHRIGAATARHRRSAAPKPGAKRLVGRHAVGHGALLATLAEHPQEASAVVDAVEVQAAQLGHPHAGRIQQLDDGVVCDQTLGTGAPGVYAAGDVARWYHPGYGQTMRVEHWTSAAEQGAIAARNATALGRPQPCTSVPYFWSDWNRDRIQFVGVPEADEVRVVAGDPDSGSFLALYRRGDRVTGALGVNRRRQVAKLRVMMAGGASWSQGRELASAPEAA